MACEHNDHGYRCSRCGRCMACTHSYRHMEHQWWSKCKHGMWRLIEGPMGFIKSGF